MFNTLKKQLIDCVAVAVAAYATLLLKSWKPMAFVFVAWMGIGGVARAQVTLLPMESPDYWETFEPGLNPAIGIHEGEVGLQHATAGPSLATADVPHLSRSTSSHQGTDVAIGAAYTGSFLDDKVVFLDATTKTSWLWNIRTGAHEDMHLPEASCSANGAAAFCSYSFTYQPQPWMPPVLMWFVAHVDLATGSVLDALNRRADDIRGYEGQAAWADDTGALYAAGIHTTPIPPSTDFHSVHSYAPTTFTNGRPAMHINNNWPSWANIGVVAQNHVASNHWEVVGYDYNAAASPVFAEYAERAVVASEPRPDVMNGDVINEDPSIPGFVHRPIYALWDPGTKYNTSALCQSAHHPRFGSSRGSIDHAFFAFRGEDCIDGPSQLYLLARDGKPYHVGSLKNLGAEAGFAVYEDRIVYLDASGTVKYVRVDVVSL